MSVSAELNHNRSPWALDSDKGVRCRRSSLYMNWIVDSHSRVDEGVTAWSCWINRLLYAYDLVLLASSQQTGPTRGVYKRYIVLGPGRYWVLEDIVRTLRLSAINPK